MPSRSRALLIVPLLLLAGTLLPGSAPAGAQERKPAKHTVTIEGTRFSPETLTVAAGDTVVWVNKDIIPHTATANSKAFDSGMLSPDASWTYTAKTKGDFPYVCTYHVTMKGRLRVR